MSRSRKKTAMVTISRAWTKFKEHAFRHKAKQFCQEAEFDPDADWAEANYKKLGDYGTKFGWYIEPGPEFDDWEDWARENYERKKRK